MSQKSGGWEIGRRIAPPRYLLFLIVLIAGGVLAIPSLGWSRGLMAGFDAAAALFLASIAPVLTRDAPNQMRAQSRRNDANRAGLLGLTGVTMIAILVAVWKEVHAKGNHAELVLVLATLVVAWIFSNTIYALHYAHLFYLAQDEGGGDRGGIDFPGDDDTPDYWDFLYFSFTLGMTFQTSDVEISSGRVRRVVLGQCLAAFVFNLGVLAFTINTIGGG